MNAQPNERNIRRRAGLLFSIFFFSSAVVFTQEPHRDIPAELSLSRAVETALAGHPDILLAREEVKAASARRMQMEARPDPLLSVGTAGIPWTLKSGEVETEYSLGMEQAFEFPGRRTARVEIARHDEDAASLEIERIGLLLTAKVKKAYYRAILADRTLQATESLSGLLDRFLEAMTIRFESGDAAYGDILRTRIEKARLQNRLIEARRERDASRAELLLLLGIPTENQVRLTDDLTFRPFESSLGQILESAITNRPSMRLARLRESRAAVEIRLASLAGKPDFEAGLFIPSKNIRGWGFSLGLSLPLSKVRAEGLRAEAAAAREKGLIQTSALVRRLTVLIGTAHANARAAEEQVKVFEQKLLAEIEAEIDNGLEQYRLGRIEAYALLDLFRSLSEARIEHLNALYLYAVALAEMETAGEEF
ncbi:MAG: TolC family protein [Candidatus Aminicenantes bacterium]|nr:TolC family protein [Candidatus Aminicenantes bacterium]